MSFEHRTFFSGFIIYDELLGWCSDDIIEEEQDAVLQCDILDDDIFFLLLDVFLEFSWKDIDIFLFDDSLRTQGSSGEIFHRHGIDLFEEDTLLQIFDIQFGSVLDVSSSSHQDIVVIFFHSFDPDDLLAGYALVSCGDLRPVGRLEETAVIRDESGMRDEGVFFLRGIEDLYQPSGRVLDVLNIWGADRHIISVFDESRVERDADVSGITRKFLIRIGIITEIVDDGLYIFWGRDRQVCARQDEAVEQIEDTDDEEDLKLEDDIEDIVFLIISMEMKFLDIEDEEIDEVQYFHDFILLLMDDREPYPLEEFLGFFCLGDKKCIDMMLLDDLLYLLSPPLVLE
jgi:hypothetical protein